MCAQGKEPAQVGPWVDRSLDEAAAYMRAMPSIALLGMGGTSKTFFASEQAQHLGCRPCRVYACAKTHVAVAGLKIEGTECTIATLQRRYVA